MERLGLDRAGPLRIGSDVVQRQQRVVSIERRVLQALGGDRPRELLPAFNESERGVPFACGHVE